jgi:exonuclease SbcC
VSRIANRLLSSAFDTRFQIAFETLKPSKDSSRQLETFSIRVLGPGGERDIADLSGGERVWIERSLAEAIAIYQSEMSGREYLSSFQDEADGALDPENRERYLAMLKESFQLGRRYYAFVVTQSSEIWQQIEQHICLVPERSAIELVY